MQKPATKQPNIKKPKNQKKQNNPVQAQDKADVEMEC